MNNMENVRVINNFITQGDAQTLIDFIEDKLSLFVYNKDRKRYMLRFGYDEELPEQAIHSMFIVKPIIDLLIQIFEKTNDVVGKDLFLTSWFISKQIPGAKLLPHKDGAKGMNDHLEYTAMLYLNDLDNNGTISFPDLNLDITPQLGDLIVFKSLEHEHMVSDVTQDRYSLPMWFTKDESLRFNGQNIY